MATDVGDVIRAVAEGATGGMCSLREAGLEVAVDAFDVEVDFVTGPGDEGAAEVSATLRLRLNAVNVETGRSAGPGPSRDIELVAAQPS